MNIRFFFILIGLYEHHTLIFSYCYVFEMKLAGLGQTFMGCGWMADSSISVHGLVLISPWTNSVFILGDDVGDALTVSAVKCTVKHL